MCSAVSLHGAQPYADLTSAALIAEQRRNGTLGDAASRHRETAVSQRGRREHTPTHLQRQSEREREKMKRDERRK